jgi:hypothetical protein
MKFRSPIFDIETSEENRVKLEALKNDFNELSNKEKFDVVEFQNVMMASLSKFNELSGINAEGETDVNGIISRMSSRSLDHSQQCMAYLKSHMACKRDD